LRLFNKLYSGETGHRLTLLKFACGSLASIVQAIGDKMQGFAAAAHTRVRQHAPPHFAV